MIAVVIKRGDREEQAVFLTPAQAKAIAKFSRLNAVSRIKAEVARHYRIEPEELVAGDRNREHAWPRHVAIYLSREIAAKTYPWLARSFGLTDHTSAIHAYRAVAKEIAAGRGERGEAAIKIRERLEA